MRIFLKNMLQFSVTFLVVIVFNNFSYAGNPMKLKVAYQLNESFPYQMGNDQQIASPPGIAVDILNAVAKKMGIDIDFVRYPNKRVQIFLKQGEIDGAFMYSFKESRMVNGRYPRKDGEIDTDRRIATLSYSLYALKGSSIRWDGNNFSGLPSGQNGTIGAGIGYSIVGDLQKMGIKVTEVNSEDQAFAMLVLDRLAAVAAQDTTADPLIKKMGYHSIVKLEPPLKSKPYFLMLSHQFVDKHPETAERLWTTIGQIREQVVQVVADKYLK